MGLARGLLNNGFAAITGQVVRAVQHLILVPFFIKYWGGELYGEWLTLSVIPSVLALSNLGFGTAASSGFVLAYASGDKQEAANTKVCGLCAITLSVVIGVLLTVVSIVICERFDFFEKSLISAFEAKIAVSLLMAGTLLSFYNEISYGFFRAARKAALGSFLDSSGKILNIILCFFILYFGGGIVMFAISSFLWILVYSVILYRVGISLIDLNGFFGVLKKKSFKALASKGMGYMMSPVWQGIYFQGTTFVVRVLLGAESVAIFNTIRTVCSSVKSLFGIIAESIFPEMQYEYGKGNIPIVQRLFRCSVLIAMLWGVLGTLGLILFGSQLYGVWTRNAFSVQSSVWNVFMFSVLLTSLWRTGTIVYRITNQPKHLAIVTLVAAVFSTLLSYLLARRFELIGVVVGSVFLDVILASTILPKACKLLNMQMRDLFVHVNKDVGLIKYYVKKPLKKILR